MDRLSVVDIRLFPPGINRPERRIDHLPPSSADLNETVELYLQSPSLGLQEIYLLIPVTTYIHGVFYNTVIILDYIAPNYWMILRAFLKDLEV